jgi:hypothetical protein
MPMRTTADCWTLARCAALCTLVGTGLGAQTPAATGSRDSASIQRETPKAFGLPAFAWPMNSTARVETRTGLRAGAAGGPMPVSRSCATIEVQSHSLGYAVTWRERRCAGAKAWRDDSLTVPQRLARRRASMPLEFVLSRDGDFLGLVDTTRTLAALDSVGWLAFSKRMVDSRRPAPASRDAALAGLISEAFAHWKSLRGDVSARPPGFADSGRSLAIEPGLGLPPIRRFETSYDSAVPCPALVANRACGQFTERERNDARGANAAWAADYQRRTGRAPDPSLSLDAESDRTVRVVLDARTRQPLTIHERRWSISHSPAPRLRGTRTPGGLWVESYMPFDVMLLTERMTTFAWSVPR